MCRWRAVGPSINSAKDLASSAMPNPDPHTPHHSQSVSEPSSSASSSISATSLVVFSVASATAVSNVSISPPVVVGQGVGCELCGSDNGVRDVGMLVCWEGWRAVGRSPH